MKKWFAYGAIFLVIYMVFLLITLPARLIVANIELPKGVDLYGVSGTVWTMKIGQVRIQDTYLVDVNVETQPLSLLTLDPAFDVAFGSAISSEPEGKLTISGLLSQPKLTDVSVNVEADLIAKQMPLPLPIDAHNYVNISLSEYVVGAPVCQVASGRVLWDGARITALDETVRLGQLAANIGCEQGALALEIDPKNDLGLSFTAYVRSSNKVSGNGYLKPGAKFPENMKPILSFLGDTDREGRYRLSF